MTKIKRPDNDLQNTTEKAKDWVKRDPLTIRMRAVLRTGNQLVAYMWYLNRI